MLMQFVTSSPEETIALGEKIGALLEAGDIIAMRGTLAAGKTTITKGIARGLGISEDVTSPTFTLISEYEGHLPLYHFDTYRLDSSEDFLNLGAEELLYGTGVCVIEWSEKVSDILPEQTIIIALEAQTDDKRYISVYNWNRENISHESTLY